MRHPSTLGVLLSLVAIMALPPLAAAQPLHVKLLTGSAHGTHIDMGRDLAQLVAPSAGIVLDIVPSAGTPENLRRLAEEQGPAVAMMQLDVHRGLLDLAADGNSDATKLVESLRVLLPLADEEIHFIVRADSKLEYIDQLRGARINVGPVGSSSAYSVARIYRLLFGGELPPSTTTFLADEEALVKLTDEGTVDVVAVIGGQPVPLFLNMRPEARRFVKLLKFDRRAPAARAVLAWYEPTLLRARNYPNLLLQDIPGLAVRTYLVHRETPQADEALSRFARALCSRFDALQARGHAKWRKVQPALQPLPPGLFYSASTTRELRACTGTAPAPPAACTQRERLLGLC